MPRRKEFDRDEIVLKAMAVFRDKGYEATSMQDLVDRMQINRFSLYATFKSKHNLFVETLDAYYENVAVPFFNRLMDSKEGLNIIKSILVELVSRTKSGLSPNGCLLCNTIAELGAKKDRRITVILERYLKTLEGYFYTALVRAKDLGEMSTNADARDRAKVLVGYTTGLLSLAKILDEKEMGKSIKATVAALR
jgi:TetR/AcrR family transcriptional regulator, transcriptional repressor for nem operon